MVDINNNKFQGSVNLSSLPRLISLIDASSNAFRGDLDLNSICCDVPTGQRKTSHYVRIDVSNNKLRYLGYPRSENVEIVM